MAEKKGPLHPDLYREAIRYPWRGPAHFMAPLAFSMASGHGQFFRPAEKPYFHLCRLCSPNARPTGCINSSAHMPTSWEGVPGDWDSRASPLKKTYGNIGETYDIVCKHMMSIFNTTSYVILRYRIPDIQYRMSKKCAYDIVYDMHLRCRMYTTYDIACISEPTISYTICFPCDLRYRIT